MTLNFLKKWNLLCFFEIILLENDPLEVFYDMFLDSPSEHALHAAQISRADPFPTSEQIVDRQRTAFS